jgi:hypothetical protein
MALTLARSFSELEPRYREVSLGNPDSIAHGLFRAARSLALPNELGSLRQFAPSDLMRRRCTLVEVLLSRPEFVAYTRQAFVDLLNEGPSLSPQAPELVDDVLATWVKSKSKLLDAGRLILALAKTKHWAACFEALPDTPQSRRQIQNIPRAIQEAERAGQH